MTLFGRRLAWIFGAPILALVSAGTTQAEPQPSQVFDEARAYWADQRYPQLVAYDVAVRIDEGNGERVERYSSYYDVLHREVHVDPVSDYEIANPVSGKGVDLFFSIQSQRGSRLSKPQPPIDFLGVPMLAPMYSFGMSLDPPAAQLTDARMTPMQIVAEIRNEFNDPAPARPAGESAPAPSAMPEIATTHAFVRDYAVAFDGEDIVDGHDCVKLKLEPLRDPNRFRLREIWIDNQTRATWKLREALNFADGPGTSVPWDVTFASLGGAQYIATETALAPMAYRGLIYRKADVSFENVQATDPPGRFPSELWNAPLVMSEPPG
jgi:hypothetical protein